MEILVQNKKIFTILFVIAVIIIIFIIWFPKKDNELSKYKELSILEIDEIASKQYGNTLLYQFYSQDIENLREKISSDYLEYNGISKNQYESWLNENKMLTANIKFNNTTKYTYKNINIYAIDAIFDGNTRKVNIIETYPEKWYYTFDTFIEFHKKAIIEEKENYGAIVNSIYQDINYIDFNCSVFINEKSNYDVNLTRSDSVKLIMKDGSSFVMATNNYTSEYTIINGKKYYNIKCLFNVPIDYQSEIERMIFYTFEINNDTEIIEIDLNL